MSGVRRSLATALVLVAVGMMGILGCSAPASAAVSASAPATPGAVYSGLGFDTCSAPPESALAAWGTASPYGAVGIYIGGVNRACSQANLSSTWVSDESAAGWHLIPIYVGLQAPGNSCGCAAITAAAAAAEGTAAALDAVAQAQALGIGTGNPIYDDMEGYTPSSSVSAAVLSFLAAWTTQLHASGYLSGVYSSGSSGITDLADAPAGFPLPDDIWVADWNDVQSVDDAYLPATLWTGPQRLHQYLGGHTESYGGVALSIDGDYLDAATAAAGNATTTTAGTATTATTTASTTTTPVVAPPAVTPTPQANGSIDVRTSWRGGQGASSYQIMAGNSPDHLAPVGSVSATRPKPLRVGGIYDYFQADALSASGTVLASGAVTPTPSGVAIFGHSAYVPADGQVGVPVVCVHTSPCKVTAALLHGSQRMTYTGTETIPAQGGLMRFQLTHKGVRLVADSSGEALPVTMTVTGAASVTGAATLRASRNLTLHTYTTSGRAPMRRAGASPSLQILSRTDFVSHGVVGGVLVACVTSTPCRATTRVTTPSEKQMLAGVHSQTVGSGELAYLSFTMNKRGRTLLRSSAGNQLAARVRVTVAPPAGAGGGARTTTSFASLTSFR